MSILLFAGLVASVAALATAGVLCLRREFGRAGQTAIRWMMWAGAYAAILAITAAIPQDSVLKTGQPYCEDDMCMSVETVSRTPDNTGTSYRFAIRLSSRANQGLRSTKGASVYLIDERQRRFQPLRDSSAVPFNTDLEPGKSVETALTFHVPSDAHTLSLAAGTDHIQYASFVIGNGDLFHNPRLKFRIQ